MVQINFALKEVNCKIVYYGPGLSGKTTNLEVVHNKAPKSNVGDLTSIATEGDRTLFFDFLPLNLGQVAGMQTKFQIYTVPGQVYYNSTRKLVLQGSDGVVFVADSRRGKMDENIESLKNLEENLREYGLDINTIPLVIQYNKRDLDDIHTVDELNEILNKYNAPTFEAVAVTGEGVFPTLKKLSSMVLEHLNAQHGSARIKSKSAVSVKEPVMAGAAGNAPTAQTPPQAQSQAAPPAQKEPSGVVQEQVSASPGVKPVERKVPTPTNKVTQKAKRKTQAPPPPPVEVNAGGKGKGGLIVAVVIAVLAAAGAVVYFTGAWKNFV